MSEPQGQTSSGTPCAVSVNPKQQPPMNDGSQSLGQGATSTGYGPATSSNSPRSGSDVNNASVNAYVTSAVSGVPATENVSAGRVREIDPGPQTLGEC